MAELQDPLPAGWESKFDKHTGTTYYVNHITKITTTNDPRVSYSYRALDESRHFPNMPVEHIPLQNGSPDLRRNYVYPTQKSPMPAFQMSMHHSPKTSTFQEIRTISKCSPISMRGAKVQDSSLIILPDKSDTEESVNKIRAMFPTVSDTHIKMLLKKYHGREVLVISALQVEKYPIATPGPFATPPPTRNMHHHGIHAPIQMTPPLSFRTGSRGDSPKAGSGTSSNYTGSPCIGELYRNSPRPHSSPKLKLRYMKSIFPAPDVTVILDVLASNDNNIQKASEALTEMGFERRNTVKIAQQQAEAKVEEERMKEEIINKPPTPLPKFKTKAERDAIKKSLSEKYKDTPEHLLSIALESVNFDEDRATQILQIMMQDEQKPETIVQEVKSVGEEVSEVEAVPVSVTTSQSRQSLKSLLKSDKPEVNIFCRVVEETNGSIEYRSPYLSNTNGPDPANIKGANDSLLIKDYLEWKGPDQNLKKGSSNLAKGPNPSLRSSKKYHALGPNPNLRKGPNCGLAKGSIFAQLRNVVVGESRGK